MSVHSSGTRRRQLTPWSALALTLGLLSGASAQAQTTYTWIGGASAPWTTATNWSPTRTTPLATDVMQFNGGGSVEATDLPTQTIGQLLISGNTTAQLFSTANVTLTIAGGSGVDLSVVAGSVLNLRQAFGGRTVAVLVGAGATGQIFGGVNCVIFSTLDAVDADGVLFESGSTFSVQTSVEPFTTAGTPNAIRFKSGARYVLAGTANVSPWGLAAPNSKVVFDHGSRYVDSFGNGGVHQLDFSGRTLGDLELNCNINGSASPIGSAACSIDNLIVTRGTLNLGMTGTFNLKGNVTVAGAGVLNFNPASPAVVTLNGPAAQSISHTGSLSSNNNQTFGIDNPAGVSLGNNLTIGSVSAGGGISFTSGRVSTGGNTLTLASGASIAGASQGTGWVNGKLKLTVTPAFGEANPSFDIGDENVYAPVLVPIHGLGAPFDLTASTTGGDHPQIASSTIDPAGSVNRFWTLTPATAPSFTTYDATFNFGAGDVDGGATPSAFFVRRYNGSAWSSTGAGPALATSTNATGMTAFSDFAVGQPFSHAITASAGAGGSISPSGSVLVFDGANQGFTIAAAACNHIVDVLVDGVSIGAVTSHTFNNVTANHTIAASFALDQFTITASAGPNGSITPSGGIGVNCGSDQSFTIAGNVGYHVLDVLVDGVSVGAVTSYPFTNVTANRTISASFTTDCLAPPANLSAWWGLDEVSGTTALNLAGPANAVYAAGVTHVAGNVGGGVHLTSASHTVTAADQPSLNFGTGSFSIDAWVRSSNTNTSVRTIVDKRGPGGVGYSLFISFGHLGLQIADAGGFSNFTTPTGSLTDGAWHLVAATVDRAGGVTGGKLYVDGVLLLTFNPTVRPGSLTSTGPLVIGQPGIAFNGDIDELELFQSALTSTEVTALYQANSFGKCKPPIWSITASAGAGGTISPNGATAVVNGMNQAYTITADACWHVSDVLVDGVSVGAVTAFNFTNVTADRTIAASFAPNVFTITASAGPNGAISPSGAVPANCTANQAFTITPAACYHVADVLVDGVSVGAVTQFTFTNVTAAHTVAASFAIDTFTLTASAGSNGSITPSGAVPANCGGGQAFAIAADANHYIADVLVDGVSVGAVASFTFTNITANHTIAASFATGCLPTPPGLTAWWTLDETFDPTAIDLVGPAHGAFVGGATHVAGQVAGGIHLANATQYVTAADDPSLNFGTGSFSIDAWVRSSDANTSVRTILDKRSSSGGPLTGYSLYISFGHLGVQLADASGVTNFGSSTGNLVDGAWHLVTATVDRAGGVTGGKLYVDGAVVSTFDPTLRPGSLTNVGPLRIGQSYNGGSIGFNGDIDEVELFARPLTSTEVTQLFQAGSNGKCKPALTACIEPPSNMLAWYPLDEVAGTAAWDLLRNSNANYFGGATHSAGKVAGALHIASSTQFVSAIDSPSLNPGTGSFSIDAWVKIADASTSVRTIVDKRSTNGSLKGYSLFISFGHLGLQLADAAGFTNFTAPTGTLTDGAWHLVAATIDRAGGATGGRLYVDGVVVSTFDPTLRAGNLNNLGSLRIGQSFDDGSINFNGDIDEVELVGRALDASEVAAIYAADFRGKCKQTIIVGVPDPAAPVRTMLMSLSNNPMRSGSSSIRFSLSHEETPEIRVFDVTGRLVQTLAPGLLPPGQHSVSWNGTGSDGRPLDRGIYFVKIRLGTSGVEGTQRLVIVR